MTMAKERLTLPEVARLLYITLDETLQLVESRSLLAGRAEDGGVYVRRRDLDAYEAKKATA